MHFPPKFLQKRFSPPYFFHGAFVPSFIWSRRPCLPNPSQHVPISIFNSFRVIPYTMLKSMRKSKNRYFYHIFVSPGDTPGAIMLNVVWMEREFDAYKLPRWMCPSNYNRFSDRARYWLKIVIFSYPLTFDVPVRGVPVGIAPPRLVRKN